MEQNKNFVFTSESVTEGHPDKMADQISDAILDEMLAQDPLSRVACETLVTNGLAVVTGEVRSRAYVDIQSVVRQTIHDIGYTEGASGYDWQSVGVLVSIGEQSPDISKGVDKKTNRQRQQGAGDQGLMFGYAVNETRSLMPLPITLAHALTARLAEVRKTEELDYLFPDGKSQVTVRYKQGRPIHIDAVVLAAQHRPGISSARQAKDLRSLVAEEVLPAKLLSRRTKFHINATGAFVRGGPCADAGLTGRKIIVDTYGGAAPHGGGAFSGKDPSKVDRSASYAARWIAKNIVAAGIATKALIQLAYVIGVADPVSVLVDTKGTSTVSETKVERAVRECFDLRPAGIIEELDLLRPIYRKTASYGHFGRKGKDFTWERTDKVDDLLAHL